MSFTMTWACISGNLPFDASFTLGGAFSIGIPWSDYVRPELSEGSVTIGRVGGEGPREACGLFGVWAPGEDVARLTFFGLFSLQHRGQESAGMAVSEGRRILVYRELGLVSQVFDESTLATLEGPDTRLCIGHTRYSTTGSTTWENAQPAFKTTSNWATAWRRPPCGCCPSCRGPSPS